MATVYSSQIDTTITLPSAVDSTTPVSASSVNILRDAIIAVEQELGVKPSAIYGTVRARLDNLEAVIQAGSPVDFAGDLSGNVLTQTVIGLQNHPVSATAPTNGQFLGWNGSFWLPASVPAGFTAGGDLSGTTTSQTVIALQGRPVSSTAPTLNYVLTWSGSAWAPAVSFVPAGDLAGTATSQTVIALQGRSVVSTAPTSNQALAWNGSAWAPATINSFVAGSDLSGTATSQTVIKLQGNAVSATAPTSGQILQWNSTNSDWEPTSSAVSIANTTEVMFSSGLFSTGSVNFTRVGSRALDMSRFPATLGTLNRTVKFYANIDKTGGATSIEVKMIDITDLVDVTSSDITSTANTNTEVSATLTVGTASGNIRTDKIAVYEVDIRMIGGTISDQVFLTNSRLVITYS